ncbi:hypothetical protein, partial [Chryseobacterium elymi]|uniref:hypothetical protein n=1 Tax=Chryseobacterium elymi TaxID=395936 RepID=UPI001EE8E630
FVCISWYNSANLTFFNVSKSYECDLISILSLIRVFIGMPSCYNTKVLLQSDKTCRIIIGSKTFTFHE